MLATALQCKLKKRNLQITGERRLQSSEQLAVRKVPVKLAGSNPVGLLDSFNALFDTIAVAARSWQPTQGTSLLLKNINFSLCSRGQVQNVSIAPLVNREAGRQLKG